jgi:hypothetical protein
VLAAIVLCALAAVPIRSTLLGPSPAFLGAYGALLVCTELLTAIVLASRARDKRDSRTALLAGAYAFSTILIAGNVLALPSVSELGFSRQTAPWLWIFWHVGWGLIVNWYAWSTTPPRLPGRALVAGAFAACVCAAVAIGATGRLPALLSAGSSWTGALWVCYGVALAVDAAALAAFLRRARRLSVIETWVCIALVAATVEIALTTMSLVRFSVGFYAARCFSVVSGIAVFASLAMEFVSLVRRKAHEERENEFRALGEAVPQILWTAGPAGDIDWYNRGWYEYTGQTPAEAAAGAGRPSTIPTTSPR